MPRRHMMLCRSFARLHISIANNQSTLSSEPGADGVSISRSVADIGGYFPQ